MRLRRRFGVLLLVLGGVFLLFVTKFFQQQRPHLSYWLKHKPLCIAENAGLLSPRRAHYSKDLEYTIDILYCTPAKPPQLVGGPLAHDLIVVSDMGGVVQRIGADGRLVWQRRLWIPRGLDLRNGRLLDGEGRLLRVLSVATGEDLQTFEVDQPLMMFRQQEDELFTVMNIEGIGSVRRYKISGSKVQLVKAAKFEMTYPRGIDIAASGLYVADTFNHRILRFDPDSLELLEKTKSYFPNSVQVINDRLIVAEEHLNVVSELSTRPLVRRSTLIGCPEHLHVIDLENIEKIQDCDLKKSVVALYSPNDAVAVDGYFYIADTDNHRVIELKDGKIVSQLTGFNDPVTVQFVAN